MMRIDECQILIVDEGDNLIGGHEGWWWERASLRVYYNRYMPLGDGVCDATHLQATCDDIQNPLRG